MTERTTDAGDTNLKALAAALQDVLAMVSHDMRTPLSVIHTTTSMLLNPKYQLTPAQIREQHERIKRNAELLNRMIGDVVDMGHLRAGTLTLDRQPVDIHDALKDALAACETPARDKGLMLSFQPGADEMRTLADRGRLTQVFQNLLGNAVKFCNAGDRITVSSRVLDGQALVGISDTGPGIAPEKLPHLFDPRPGLGLFISKGIAEAHGGQIRCESTPGTTTTFIVTLPLAES